MTISENARHGYYVENMYWTLGGNILILLGGGCDLQNICESMTLLTLNLQKTFHSVYLWTRGFVFTLPNSEMLLVHLHTEGVLLYGRYWHWLVWYILGLFSTNSIYE